MQASVATVTFSGLTPLSQSRQHEEPFLKGETHEDYDIRTWRSHLNVSIRGGKPTVVIPAHAVLQSLAAAAKYSKRQIPGQGKATWTAKFLAGLMMFGDPAINIDPETVGNIAISANADGVRGSGKRVTRRYPMIPQWETCFEVAILDPIITESIFREMAELDGMFVGFGRFRPEKGGTNGRFLLSKLEWQDNREIVPR